MDCAVIPKFQIENLVNYWLQEDAPSFEIGGSVVGTDRKKANLFMKQTGVIAGVPFFNAVFEKLDCSVRWNEQEGTHHEISDRKIIAEVEGRVCDILLGERIALNVLARASGIATRSRFLVKKKEPKSWKGVVAGTRKTTPGFRLVEKHAMLVGGADTHRMDLSSMVMLKDNHVWSLGSIHEAVTQARARAGFSMKIEVECQSEQDAREAIAAGADVVMLDNFEHERLANASSNLKQDHPHIIVEASGGITPENIEGFMLETIDVISTSWIHQGVPHIDFSLKIPKD